MPRAPSHPAGYISVCDLASMLAVSPKTVRRYLAAGRLRAVKLAAGRPGAVRIARAEVERFLAGCARPVAAVAE